MSQIKTASEVFEPIASCLNPNYKGDTLFNMISFGKYLLQLHCLVDAAPDDRVPVVEDCSAMRFPAELETIGLRILELGFKPVEGTDITTGRDQNFIHFTLYKDGYLILLDIINYGEAEHPNVAEFDPMLQDYVASFLLPAEYFVVAQLTSNSKDLYFYLVDIIHPEKGYDSLIVSQSKTADIPHITKDYEPLTNVDERASEFDRTMINHGYAVYGQKGINDGRCVMKQYGDWVFTCFQSKPVLA